MIAVSDKKDLFPNTEDGGIHMYTYRSSGHNKAAVAIEIRSFNKSNRGNFVHMMYIQFIAGQKDLQSVPSREHKFLSDRLNWKGVSEKGSFSMTGP